MTDTGIQAPKSALLDGPGTAKKAEAPLIAQVAKAYGVSPLRQMREIFSMRRGAQKLSGPEYYSMRLFDPSKSTEEKRAFLGQAGINALNTSMNPPIAVPTRAFVGNKLLYTQLLTQLGMSTSTTQAIFSTHMSVGHLPTARNAADLAAFLRTDARYPVFGKPHFGSLSTGAVRIEARSDDMLRLFDGTTHDVDTFAEHVAAQYPGGFMLQSALSPHSAMAHIAGPAIGCVRVVTANNGSGPKPVYAVWKMPAAGAISDNTWQDGILLSHIELDTGTLLSLVRGTGLEAETLSDHPVSGAPVVGQTLPFWEETLRLATDAHAVFPEFGVCGFDVAVTDEGPKILECNDNPSHMMYQRATGRGIQNPDLAPIWQAVVDRQTKQVARLQSASKGN